MNTMTTMPRSTPPSLPSPLSLIVATLLAAAVVAGAPAGAFAQGAFAKPGQGREKTTPPGEEVVVSVTPARTIIRPGETLAIAVILDHAPGWHSWPSAAQDVLPESIADFALRTEVGLSGETPAWIDAVGPVQWPTPAPAPVANPAGGAPISVKTYQGRAIAYLPVIVAQDAPAGKHALDIRVFFQACDESVCLPPRTETRTITFTVVPAGAVVRTAEPDPATFANFDARVFARMQDGSAGGGAAASTSAGTAPPATPAPPGRHFFGIAVPRGDSVLGAIVLALLGIAGGFILNLTPCVLPVIPIKVLTISKHAASSGRALTLGLWMCAGIVAFWVGIGLPMAFFSAVSDPSRLFGIWWVTLGIGVLIAAMGLGIMGLFMINLPNSVYMLNPKADTPGGSFMFGVMTAVLGLPCFGFVAGALLAGAATLPTWIVLLIFGSLGVGMALPYLVLSARPELVDKIPKTGPASELVKQVMGLLLLAASAYFIGAGLIALVSDRPWMSRQLQWWGIAFFASLAGLWLIVRTFQISPRPIPRAVFSLVALVLAGAAIVFAANSTADAKRNYLARAGLRSQTEAQFLPGVWNEYAPARLEAALAAGKVVVLDFTAEWCLNCKALKAAVLDRDPVKGAMANADVVPIEVDLTSTKAPGWEKLKELGQTGIPLLVVYGPGLDEPWQSNAYTPTQVLDALERAGAGSARTASATN